MQQSQRAGKAPPEGRSDDNGSLDEAKNARQDIPPISHKAGSEDSRSNYVSPPLSSNQIKEGNNFIQQDQSQPQLQASGVKMSSQARQNLSEINSENSRSPQSIHHLHQSYVRNNKVNAYLFAIEQRNRLENDIHYNKSDPQQISNISADVRKLPGKQDYSSGQSRAQRKRYQPNRRNASENDFRRRERPALGQAIDDKSEAKGQGYLCSCTSSTLCTLF